METVSGTSRPSAGGIPVFDLGGVIVDWNPRHLFRKYFPNDPDALEHFLIEIDFWNWNAAMDAGRPIANAVREWAMRFPQYADAIRAFEVHWEDIVAGPIPGMPELLDRLRGKRIPLYALSNISAENLPILVSRYAFLKRFERIVASAEIGINKPDPGLFEYFLQQTGRRKEDLLFIDDIAENVAAARKLGWTAIRFTGAAELEKEISVRGLF